jgi:Ca2+-binding RTX toxin-like protein
MANYLYEVEIIKKDAAGNYSVSDLTVDTESTSIYSGTPGTEFIVDGVSLGPDAPTMYLSTGPNNGTVTLQNGNTVQAGTMSFFVGTDEYFILQSGLPGSPTLPDSEHIDANRVASLAFPNKVEMSGSAAGWDQFMVIDRNADIFQGYTLVQSAAQTYVQEIYVADDDPLFEISRSGTSEKANPPHTWTTGTSSSRPKLDDLSFTTANTVKITYTTATGTGQFEAVATSNFAHSFYIPLTGSVDLSTVTGITSVAETTTPISGLSYNDFGLTADKFVLDGDAGDNLLVGDIGHDKLNGKNGVDTLFGDGGDDLLKGGKGGDTLYGGIGDDKLLGEKGDDFLFGGMGNDDMQGGAGKDTLDGASGNDVLRGNGGADVLVGDRGDDILKGDKGKDILKGGAGKDTLRGGDGKDTLRGGGGQDKLVDGSGADTMTGGGGVDTFVIRSDGKTDTITDFENGTDLIDIDVAYAALTITDGAAGEVLITHSGETLVVQDDGAGLLSAADFSAADFL